MNFPSSPEDVTQDDADRLCKAATAVFFSVLRLESIRHDRPVIIPFHLLPDQAPPCPCTMCPELVREAEEFLIRLGVIEVEDDHLRLIPF